MIWSASGAKRGEEVPLDDVLKGSERLRRAAFRPNPLTTPWKSHIMRSCKSVAEEEYPTAGGKRGDGWCKSPAGWGKVASKLCPRNPVRAAVPPLPGCERPLWGKSGGTADGILFALSLFGSGRFV